VASVIERLHVGGDENRLLTFSRALDRSRFRHLVIVGLGVEAEADRRIGPMLRRYEEHGVDVEVLDINVRRDRHLPECRKGWRPGSAVSGVVNGGRLLRSLVSVLRRQRVDVVDGRLEFGTFFGTAAARLAGVPVVVATGYSPVRWKPPFYYLLGQACMAATDAWISDAQVTIDEYETWRLSHRSKLVVIPNGIYPTTTTKTVAEMRRFFGLPSDASTTIIGQVARMIPRKGYEDFLRTARLVRDVRPDTAFLMCGFAEEPAFRSHLQRMAADLDLRDCVRIVDYPGNIGDVYRVIDLFAHLSVFDSSPLAVHESMSAGLPAVVTRVGGSPELVIDGQTGLLVPPADPVGAANALLRLLDEEGLARRLGAGAHGRFVERHQADVMARAHESLFDELLDKTRG